MASESETMRVEFERWLREESIGDTTARHPKGLYVLPEVEDQWFVWQAAWSRAPSASEPKASIEAKDALVTDTMVETVGKALYIYWGDVKEETRAKYYRPKVRAALNKALL